MEMGTAMKWKYIALLPIIISTLLWSDELRQITVSDLHNWFSSSGCEREVSGPVGTQIDGLDYPALYRNQDVQAAKGIWIGARNYDDPIVERHFDYKVVGNGPRKVDELAGFMPQEFKLIGRFNHPMVLVDGLTASTIEYTDQVDEIDETMTADRCLVNVVNTSMGITMKRKIFAFTHPDHSNYMVQEYTFTNTGIYDLNGSVKADNDLQDLWVYYQYRYGCAKDAADYYLNVVPRSAKWGRNQMNDFIFTPYRAIISWNGRHHESAHDNIGAPALNTDGHLASPHFAGIVILHADKSPQETFDDPTQPATTYYIGSNDVENTPQEQFNDASMTAKYLLMSAEHPLLTHAQDVEASGKAPSEWGDDGGGYSAAMGFGPYQIAAGNSIRIVWAEGIGVLSREKCNEIGGNWLSEPGNYTLPDDITTKDRDEYKNAWVYTGRDSLLKFFGLATENYESGYILPLPPDPPTWFEVQSGGDRIALTWDSNAELNSHFAGYRIYRALMERDSTYHLIFECGPGTGHPDIVNEYQDTSPIRGFDYYYYMESFDDGWSGKELVSSKFYTLTSEPAYLRRMASDDLSAIRIVPNPFNIRSRDFQYGSGDGADRIMFLNLPPFCTIDIYTERGDKIKTIEHTDATGDESWDQVTSTHQNIVSGIYIAYIHTPNGRAVNRKFIIIR